MTKAWLPLGLIAGGWFFQRSYQANSWPKRAETFNADLDDDEYPPANPLRIIIGGPPHSGKSTLMNLLEDKFRQYGVSVELRDLDLASKTDLKGGFDINREKKDWTPELAEEAATLFDEPTDDRVILGDSIGLVSQLNEIVSEPADVAILLVGGSYGNNDDEYRSQLNKWERYYDAIDKPVLMVIRSSMNPNEENYFDPHDNFGVIVGLDRPTYQQREEEGKRKGERKISLENACLEGMVFEIAQAYDLRLENEITPAHKDNIKRVWPTIQSHRGKPKNPIFIKIEDEYYQQKGWNAEFGAEKKNCGCGKDPCVTYGADYNPSNDPSYEDSVKEFEKLKSKIPSMEVRSALAYADAKNRAIERIAKDGGWETLEERNLDRLDFKEISVWNLKDMLSKSYDEGYEKGVLKWKGYSQMREGMGAESDAYAFAYNEGHSDSRKKGSYHPTLETKKDESEFRKVLKQRAEDDMSEEEERWKRGKLRSQNKADRLRRRMTRILREKNMEKHDAETFEAEDAEYQELIDLSNEAKENYMELVDESDIEEFCEEYDLDYNDYDDRKRAVSKYLDQIPFEPHIIEALDQDEQERYYQLKAIVYGAETFNAKTAPPLESYTKDELIDSIAGPQGSATYDEMEYDPVAQSRLSAEKYDDEAPTIVLVDLSGSAWYWLDNRQQTIIGVVAEQVKNLYDNRVGDMIIVGYGSSGGDMELEMPYGRYTRILSPDGGTRTNFLKGYGGKSDWSSMSGDMPVTKELIEAISNYMGLSEQQAYGVRIINFTDGIRELPNNDDFDPNLYGVVGEKRFWEKGR